MTHVRNSNSADRAENSIGEKAFNERYWHTEDCPRCSTEWGFWRYPHRQQAEYLICSECTAKQWAKEQAKARLE